MITFPVPKKLTEAVEMTLSEKEDRKDFQSLKCIERECDNCGVDKS